MQECTHYGRWMNGSHWLRRLLDFALGVRDVAVVAFEPNLLPLPAPRPHGAAHRCLKNRSLSRLAMLLLSFT
jgi:hypothetical protein